MTLIFSDRTAMHKSKPALNAIATSIVVALLNVPLMSVASVATVDPAADYSSSSSSITTNHEARQQLSRIVTSDDYASKQSVESWQAIEEAKDKKEADTSWLEDFLESIGILSDSSDDTDDTDDTSDFDADSVLNILSILLKALFIIALVAFIMWVLNRAGYAPGWINRINPFNKMRNMTQNHAPNAKNQDWEQLPLHEDIPTKVRDYIEQNNATLAASLLYRGSLRWLARTQQLSIIAADTEAQCLAQIHHLERLETSQPHAYIVNIIEVWMQIAYDEKQRSSNNKALNQELKDIADDWLATLSHSRTANHNTRSGHSIASSPSQLNANSADDYQGGR